MKKVYFVFYSVHDAEFGERTIADDYAYQKREDAEARFEEIIEKCHNDMYVTLKNICINTLELK